MAFHAACTPAVMAFHSPAKKPVTPLHADCTVCAADWNVSTMPFHSPVKKDAMDCHACWSQVTNADHIRRPVSVCVKK